MKRRAIKDPKVAAVFRAYPAPIRGKLMELRQLIFDVASRTDGVGELLETLRWGQPSYVTAQTGSGTLIRIDQMASPPGTYAMYFHCQTTLVGTFRRIFRDDFTFLSNRGILFQMVNAVPTGKLRRCVALALTYHLGGKSAPKTLAARARARRSAAAAGTPSRRHLRDRFRPTK
jgi:hypothetical protein